MPPEISAGKKRMVVFAIDDQPVNLDLIARTLSRDGYEVIPFENAQIALDALRKNTPDLILADYRMPDLDGVAFFTEVRRRGVSCPGLLVTAYTDAEEVTTAEKGG